MTTNSVPTANDPNTKRIAVLGSTGSIGTSALEVIAASEGRLRAIALSAHRRLDLLVTQAHQFRPRWVIATDPVAADRFRWNGLPLGTELLVGEQGLEEVAASDEVDVVLAGIVGSAGLRSTWAAIEAKKTVALANKETLVMGGAPGDRAGRQARRDDPAGRQRAQRGISGRPGWPARGDRPRRFDRQRRTLSPPVQRPIDASHGRRRLGASQLDHGP